MQPSQEETQLNPWIITYIEQHRDTKSRYEIDKFLLESGYNPAEVEAAWKAIESPIAPPQPKTNPGDLFVKLFIASLLLVYLPLGILKVMLGIKFPLAEIYGLIVVIAFFGFGFEKWKSAQLWAKATVIAILFILLYEFLVSILPYFS